MTFRGQPVLRTRPEPFRTNVELVEAAAKDGSTRPAPGPGTPDDSLEIASDSPWRSEINQDSPIDRTVSVLADILPLKVLRSRRARPLLGLISVTVFVLVWHLTAVEVASPYLPRPAAVIRALVEAAVEKDFLGFTITQHVTASLLRIVYGFALSILIAVPLGLATGWFPILNGLTAPVVEILRPIPPLAWIPFAIYFFGSPFDTVFLVLLASFFPVYLNTRAGVRSIDPILVDAARTLGARRLRLFTAVIVPAALGSIMTGMRVGLGIAWMSIVAAEMVGVKGGGLGVYIWSMAEVGRFDAVFAGMVLIGLLGLVLTGGMGSLERRYALGRVRDA